MSTRFDDVLNGKEENYILPFFWQHGEEEDVLREEMARIHEAEIKAVCVEARPHPDFLGSKWWKDMNIIMEEARNRGMRVWILDDDHFPTGHAAGKLKDAPKELRRLFLSVNHVDAFGPRPNASFIVEPPPYVPGYYDTGGGTIAAVIAIKRDSVTGQLTDISKDLTAKVESGKLYWDIPEGYWRIFTIIENERGGDLKKNDYLNPLVKESVKVLIDTVYEAFYERYQDDFGRTIAGFFSDEPGFYNNSEGAYYDSKLGKQNMSLPWSADLYKMLKQEFGQDYMEYLPFLWHDGKGMSEIRYCYMDLITKLYAENFTNQIGDWCRGHGVEYIGHVLEDNNVHARLGSGAGHFFRALGGQDMAGLDVVLWQLNPGFDEIPSRMFAGEADNEFFNYGLAKMATSLAHMDPKKKGRTMAEVFGAYGWVEGLKLMKWMTDHMLVRGVNYFVPHAFSPKEYPDYDCPPHMYARGKNPQYRYYKFLNKYTNRMSHLLSAGEHVASAAVLYHAEAEWSTGEYMFFQKPVKELMRNQIDCDIFPCDAIIEGVEIHNEKLVSNGETFDCLIIPYSEALPVGVINRFADFAKDDLPIFFIEGLPERSCEGEPVSDVLELLALSKNVKTVPLKDLVKTMKKAGYFDIQVREYQPYLRYYHVTQQEMEIYMFFNEHPLNKIDTEVWLPIKGEILSYDSYDNSVRKAQVTGKFDGSLVSIKLAPFETVVIVSGFDGQTLKLHPNLKKLREVTTIESDWLLSTSTSEQYPKFIPRGKLEELTDLSRMEGLQSFSGTMRYETDLKVTSNGERVCINLGDAYETVEVFVNDESIGVRLQAPYQFELSGYLADGSNSLRIEVTNTLVKEDNDMLSRIGHHEPSGLLGPVRLLVEEK